MTESLNAKLDALAAFIVELRELCPEHFEAYENNKMLRRYAERLLHMTIDTCIQSGIEILTAERWRTPENYHDVFIALGEHGMLTAPLVRSMTMMVELRNVLVYEYDVMDHMMVYSVLKRRLDDLAEFENAARAYATGAPYIPSPLFENQVEE